jgi:hypothetical protein
MMRISTIRIFIFFMGLLFIPPIQAKNSNFYFIPSLKHDVSLPLTIPSGKLSDILDYNGKVDFKSKKLIPVSVYPGLGYGFNNYEVKAINPDVNGSVGMSQYVQLVNYDMAVFDKGTGKILDEFPKPNNAIWKGFGGQCENELGKYSIIKYDQLAHRWVLTYTTTSYLCVAISLTEDATGSYNRYAFGLNTRTEDAKLGLWPNAYFMSFNIPDAENNAKPLVCALDREKMLAGQNNGIQCTLVHYLNVDKYLYVMPADLDGTKLPAIDTPGYFLGRYSEDDFFQYLVFFKFYVDFKFPENTHLSMVSKLSNGLWWSDHAVQPGGYLIVDKNGRNFNHRIVYRQYLDYGSLIVSQTAKVNGGLGPFWHEFRFDKSNTDPKEYQSSYYQYDQTFSRYTGSIAMDKMQNIVVANNISSSVIYPSIEFHSRTATDSLGTLPYTQPLVTGAGAMINSSNTWGNYSSLSLDPIDDCTFWYTNAYMQKTGPEWSTSIIKFKMPNCE